MPRKKSVPAKLPVPPLSKSSIPEAELKKLDIKGVLAAYAEHKIYVHEARDLLDALGCTPLQRNTMLAEEDEQRWVRFKAKNPPKGSAEPPPPDPPPKRRGRRRGLVAKR